MNNPRSSAGILGDMNITKIIMIAAGGALLWDYLTSGRFIGVFGPAGFINSLFSATAPATSGRIEPDPNGPGPFAPRPMPTADPVPTPGPTPGAPTPGQPATPTPSYADYLKTIVINPGGAVKAGDTAVGGDTNRDLAKFNSDNRYRNTTLSRAAQGAPYSIAIVRSSGIQFNWDQWNWHRGQNSGTPIDIDALGVADQRGTNVTIDQFLAVAGADPSESGMGNVASGDARFTGLEWLM